MKMRPKKPRKVSRPRAVLVTAALLIVLGLGGWWVWPDPSPAAGGAPKLALDRTEIDLGSLRFNAPAHAVFTITNTGDGLLTLRPGRVRVVQGC